MRKKIMTLMMGALLLLTACGQTGNSSPSTMLPVAAVRSAAQVITPAEGKTQGDAESPPTVETVEETQAVSRLRNPPRTRKHLPTRRRNHRLHLLERSSPTCRSSRLRPNSR